MVLVPVPANMTHFFSHLTLQLTGQLKIKQKKEFISWYSAVVTVIKPLHAQWLVNVYNFFLGEHGQKVILKGWKKAGIVLMAALYSHHWIPFRTSTRTRQ